MLDGDHDHAREIRAGPFLEKLIPIVLDHPLVAVLRAERALVAVGTVLRDIGDIGRRQLGVRRGLAPPGHFRLEVPVIDRQRIVRVWMRVPALGQRDERTEVCRPAPELRQPLAQNLDPFDVLGVGRLGDRCLARDVVRPGAEHQAHRAIARGVDPDPGRRTIEIARRARPLLPLTAIRRQLHGVTVRPCEGLVDVQQALHPVLAWRQIVQALDRIAEHVGIDDRVLTRRKRLDVDAENLRGPIAVRHLEARLRLLVGRDEQQHPAVDRVGRLGRWHRQEYSKRRRGGMGAKLREAGRDCYRAAERHDQEPCLHGDVL